MKKKNIITIISIVIALGILITGGILAYLTDTDQKTNVFTVGSVKINLTEANWNPTNGEDILPGDEISKDPKIDNVGRNSAYVYIKVEQPAVTLSTGEGTLFDYTTNSGWTLLGTNANQGCPTTTSVYYYNTALNPSISTSTLFDEVVVNDFVDLNDTYPMEIVVTGYAIQSNNLPSGTTIQNAYNTYFENSGLEGCTTPIIQATTSSDTTAFRNATYKSKIKTITLDDHINEPENVIESCDIGVNQNGDVMAYVTQNSDDNTMYDLYIQGNGRLYANPDSSYMFANLRGVDSINGLDKLNTSKVTDMSYMFYNTGYNSTLFTLDLGNHFDTSKVTNMYGMFYYTGYNSPIFTLDLGNHFDTSNVTNMHRMFFTTGINSTLFTLDLGNKFDTSNVTDMNSMFYNTGESSTIFTLDLGDKFDTSKVTNMKYMFFQCGFNSPVFTLDLGDKFDTSKVTNMDSMFYYTGFNSAIFTLDLGDKFDTSEVTNMDSMFNSTGYNSPVFTLDLGDKFDTSNVTSMASMFARTGYSSQIFTLDLGNKFDTSKVTNMYGIFNSTGYSSPNFTLNLGNKFDITSISSTYSGMGNMFYNTGYSNSNLILDLSTFTFDSITFDGFPGTFNGMTATKKIYVKDIETRDFLINNNSNLTTSNVLIKP